MKIYTRSGDTGETALFGGRRVRKDDQRVEAYGEVDELNSAVGLAVAAMEEEVDALIRLMVERLRMVQEDLFAIGAHLATPEATTGGRAATHLPPLPEDRPPAMEAWIDEADAVLEPLRTFILPGGNEAAARLHLTRTICRRAERRVLTLSGNSPIDGCILVYLNRLSDLLFTFARLSNFVSGAGDVPWIGRRQAPHQ